MNTILSEYFTLFFDSFIHVFEIFLSYLTCLFSFFKWPSSFIRLACISIGRSLDNNNEVNDFFFFLVFGYIWKLCLLSSYCNSILIYLFLSFSGVFFFLLAFLDLKQAMHIWEEKHQFKRIPLSYCPWANLWGIFLTCDWLWGMAKPTVGISSPAHKTAWWPS